MSFIDEDFSAYVIPYEYDSFYEARKDQIPYTGFSDKVSAYKRQSDGKKIPDNAYDRVNNESFHRLAVFLLFRCLENKNGEIPEIIMGEDGNFCLAEGSNLPVKTFKPNSERNAVAQLLYRWAKAFYEFREEADDLAFDRNVLLEIFCV